jgi:hypothetical protein
MRRSRKWNATLETAQRGRAAQARQRAASREVKQLLTCLATAVLLDWRTLDRTIRTEDAAIRRLRSQSFSAAGAFIEEYALICRHDLYFGVSARWAGYNRFEDYWVHVFSLSKASKSSISQSRFLQPT